MMINPQYSGIICVETTRRYEPRRTETAYIVPSKEGTKIFIDFENRLQEISDDFNERKSWIWTSNFGPPIIYPLSERCISLETDRKIKAAGLDKLVSKS